MNRLFQLAYSNVSSPHSKVAVLHQARDGMAYIELAGALEPLGYSLGTTIHLIANDPRPLSELKGLKIGAGDMLALTTRPPLNDPQGPDPNGKKPRKNIMRNGGDLEKIYMAALKPYFAYCDRAVVELGEKALPLLGPRHAHLRRMQFSKYLMAQVTKVANHDNMRQLREEERFSVAFLVRLPSLPEIGCGFIAAFSMCGFTTLTWNRILRSRHSAWLTTRRFVMARLNFHVNGASHCPMTPEFADKSEYVEVEVLVEEAER